MPAFWSAVRSLPHREAYAAERLRRDHGFEVFLPLVQTKRASQPLFRSYLFCRIVEQWRIINSTFGVLCLVRVGDCPCKIPDYEIQALKARADASGIIRLPPPPPEHKYKNGDRVKIIAGQFAHFDAIHTGLSAKARERVLISILGGRREVTVASHLIAAQ
jgi:transcription antitermination factor NusG